MRGTWLLVALFACGGESGDPASCGSSCGTRARAEPVPLPDLVAIREAADQTGQLVALASDGSHVRVVHPAQMTTRIYPHTSEPIWSADGHYLLYPTDGSSDSLEVIELRADGSFGPPRTLGDALSGCALPDGRFVVQDNEDCVGGGFECVRYYDVTVVDPTTLAKTRIGSSRGGGGIACSALGKVAFGGDGLAIATSDGVRQLDARGPFVWPLAWMRDDRRVVVGGGELGTIDVATDEYRKLFSGDCDSAEAIDDHRVRAVCDQKLVVVDADAPSGDGDATTDATTARSSPDGSRLAYTHGTMVTDAPLVIAPNAGGAAIATLPGRWADPAWRPHAALAALIAFKPLPPRPPRPRSVAEPWRDPAPPASAPPAQIRTVVGDTTRDGKPDQAAQRVVETRRGILRACFQSALQHDPKLAGGTLTLELAVDTTGAITGTKTGGTIHDARVKNCGERVARLLKFPAAGVGTVHTSVTYVMSSGP